MTAPLLKKITIPALATFGLLLCVMWMAGYFYTKIEPETLTLAADTPSKTYQVKVLDTQNVESVPAGLRARETTLVSSRIMARIEQIHVRAGDLVEKGTPLVTLENKALIAQVEQAKAQVESIKALTNEANLNLERTVSLKKQGLASNSDLDKAQANYHKLLSDLDAAKQTEEEAITALGYSKILSPMNGRIVDRNAEPGNIATPGQTLLSLYNPLSLLVEANVREGLAIKLKIGQAVNVKLEALGRRIPASISEMVPAADPNARSFIVKADIQYERDLLPGMFARMEIETDKEQQIQVPHEFVQSYGQLDMVWVLQNHQLIRRYVRLGENTDKDKIEIVSGLSPGEVIALPGT